MPIAALLEPGYRKEKQDIFRREVCDQYCKVCAAEAPDFCMSFFGHLGQAYFEKLIFIVNCARERAPQVYNELTTFEGFVALFCDARLCPFFNNLCNLRKRIDCYQIFLLQSNMSFEPGEEADILSTYSERTVESICQSIDNVRRTYLSQSKKKRKRLMKIANRIISMIAGFTGKNNNRFNGVRLGRKRSIITPPPKKEVTTQLFYSSNEIFTNRVKSILEGDIRH